MKDAIGVILFTTILICIGTLAYADSMPAQGSGYSWNVTLPVGATDTSIRIACYDCDYRDEATLTVNGGQPLVLFGSDDTSRDGRVVPITLAIALNPGANTLTFACTRRSGCIRVDAVDAIFTVPVSDWMTTAKALQESGWIPAWLTVDDRIWVVSREDTDPSRALVCLQDTQTGNQAVAWVDSTLTGFPQGNSPAVTECERQWCFASGELRSSAINSACR